MRCKTLRMSTHGRNRRWLWPVLECNPISGFQELRRTYTHDAAFHCDQQKEPLQQLVMLSISARRQARSFKPWKWCGRPPWHVSYVHSCVKVGRSVVLSCACLFCQTVERPQKAVCMRPHERTVASCLNRISVEYRRSSASTHAMPPGPI